VYVPKHFAVRDRDALAFMEREPFGIVVSVESGVPVATHVPIIVLEREPQLTLGLHVAKANPQWQMLEGVPTLAIFHGPHALVSASWYAQPQQDVPTWDYSAVHCTGTAHIASASETREILDRTVAQLDPAWRIEDADADYIARMQQAIVGVRIVVDRTDGVAKFSQNRTVDDRLRVIDALSRSPRAMDREVAAIMEENRS